MRFYLQIASISRSIFTRTITPPFGVGIRAFRQRIHQNLSGKGHGLTALIVTCKLHLFSVVIFSRLHRSANICSLRKMAQLVTVQHDIEPSFCILVYLDRKTEVAVYFIQGNGASRTGGTVSSFLAKHNIGNVRSSSRSKYLITYFIKISLTANSRNTQS